MLETGIQYLTKYTVNMGSFNIQQLLSSERIVAMRAIHNWTIPSQFQVHKFNATFVQDL